ncbi:ribokinase [Deinococcus cellulosilyticus]|uniref:Ribokinase n=1 Tax=Deinococcus cellulosilyticus (strain DSM 18568 / NBRC 106333 / KACC 11606 / 5516J-15) TaxID=1223518 RepID=A0A511N4W7_DEIC1|nr:ribokinase [Deinococcus cellulosilyticus]GEM47899.1 ribokinase [Deinococcus cellulosilyticus NBRC 106333 = KACC 11606]
MILVAGSANLDFVVRASRIPAPGETVLGENFETFAGGKGANQAVACARAGGKVAFLGALGRDLYGDNLLYTLQADGVNTRYVKRVTEPTGAAFITVSPEGENAITVASGANNTLKPEHLPSLKGFKALVMPLETPMPTVVAYYQKARDAGLKTVLNAAPATRLPEELFPLLDVMVTNQHEIFINAPDHDNYADAAQDILRKGVGMVIITLGSDGCLLVTQEKTITVPAIPIEPVDTTGAGDTFVGAFLAEWMRGTTVEQAARFAVVASGIACTKVGAQASMPRREEILEGLQSQTS